MRISEIFLLFIVYSIFGWLIEVGQSLILDKKFVNRGFLIGPYCPIYGVGGVLITVLLTKFSDSPLALFVLAMVICAFLEYYTSYFMEKLFNARWWDYSNKKLNINGRICLETLIPFGLLGLTIIYLINPLIFNLFDLIGTNTCNILFELLLIGFSIDLIISLQIISDFRKKAIKFLKKDNTEEISKKVKERLDEVSNLINARLVKAFPNINKKLVLARDNLLKKLDEHDKKTKIKDKIKEIFKK